MELSCVCAPEALDLFQRFGLVAGHPGHELRVFGWMSEYKPRVYVLTDGSGHHGISRIPSTGRLLRRVKGESGEIFGGITDAGMYAAIRERDFPFFLGLLDGLASSFIKDQIDFVAADATEGFNPTHDLCRALVDAAVLLVQRSTGKTIANYEFCLAEWEQHSPEFHDARCLHLRLDDDLLRRKLEAAEDYLELREEVRQGVARRGEEYFRTECLRKITTPLQPRRFSGKPFYETCGEQRVANGKYESVIRFEEHMLPILDAIHNHAAGTPLGASTLLTRA